MSKYLQWFINFLTYFISPTWHLQYKNQFLKQRSLTRISNNNNHEKRDILPFSIFSKRENLISRHFRFDFLFKKFLILKRHLHLIFFDAFRQGVFTKLGGFLYKMLINLLCVWSEISAFNIEKNFDGWKVARIIRTFVMKVFLNHF